MVVLTVFSTALLLTLLITPLVRQIGLTLGWVDRPGERKLHQQSMVRIGGVAIATGTLIALLLIGQLGAPLFESRVFLGVILGSIGFFTIGLADDVLNLPPVTRLLLQAVAAGVAWSLGVRLEAVPMPGIGLVSVGILSLPITFLWLAGVANAINWMDGLDGLAAGMSTIVALTLSMLCLGQHSGPIALIAMALAGAGLGFLRYNATPARIFMGDGGSYFIGFLLAAVSVSGVMTTQSFTAVLLPYVALAVPVLDMLLVIVSRVLDGKSPLFADQRHLHHRLLRFGFSRPATVWLMYGLTLWAGMSAIVLSFSPLGWLGVMGVLALLGCSYLVSGSDPKGSLEINRTHNRVPI
ncbi:hypothetical protein BST81_08340 [Leptolyngbya sp. 'hensonii']|uniref:glycosyltransferase family 4 protein n=1 Tax=Leptolyngbya sp. 'hensonii' TaxID=1922337 RepID=UPI000950049F|nr:MraY family glycosyltransferase [Leptolyngbya sp. 'hensonii']OLP18913.1 hypothetical protein BST81_08340 [Leptolyngbya sp. 'hensonii']